MSTLTDVRQSLSRLKLINPQATFQHPPPTSSTIKIPTTPTIKIPTSPIVKIPTSPTVKIPTSPIVKIPTIKSNILNVKSSIINMEILSPDGDDIQSQGDISKTDISVPINTATQRILVNKSKVDINRVKIERGNNAYSNPELKEIALSLGLKVSGNRKQLVERIKDAIA